MHQISFLIIGLLVLTFVIAFLFKKNQRTILWTAALIIFIGTSLAIGLGIIKFVENDKVNSAAIINVALVFFCSALLVCGAEKTHEAIQKKASSSGSQTNNQNEISAEQETPNDKEQQKDDVHVQLPQRLNTELARKIFSKAINAGMMEEKGNHYKWKQSKVLLSYMCGRIYCEDRPKYNEREEKTFWKCGRTEFFPDSELNELFMVTDIGQSRQNRKDRPVPQGSEKIDELF